MEATPCPSALVGPPPTEPKRAHEHCSSTYEQPMGPPQSCLWPQNWHGEVMTSSFKTWWGRCALIAMFSSPFVARAQIPMTNRPVNDAKDDFRFAVLPDRNGAMRPGL